MSRIVASQHKENRVYVTLNGYRHDHFEHEIEPHELLQMIGRAGRRGLDEFGYVLVSGSSPRMRR